MDMQKNTSSKSSGKTLCIGEALIDMICTDKGKTLSEGNNFLKKTGGAPTNVAAAIAALGGGVELAAKVGIDPFGKQLVDEMQFFGVSTKYMLQDSNYFTSFAFVSLMDAGERDFYFNRGADGQLTVEEVDSIDLDEIAIVHFGSATAFLPGPLQAAYRHLLQKAKQKNIFISFDPNYRQLLFKNDLASFIEQSWVYLKACQFFKVSDEEAMIITETDSVEKAANILLKNTTAIFAITLGEAGTMMGFNNTTVIIPSIPVKPIDTTGAGDAFVGAVLYQLSCLSPDQILSLSDQDWSKIMANGNKAGARTCEYMGGMDAFKNLSNQIFD
jgi:fructokinase